MYSLIVLSHDHLEYSQVFLDPYCILTKSLMLATEISILKKVMNSLTHWIYLYVFIFGIEIGMYIYFIL